MEVTDPVCKMIIDESDAVATSLHKGTTYYFCTEHCKEVFDKNPEVFLSDKNIQERISSPGTYGMYTCPMHPDVKQEEYGSCPQCGMALEPVGPVSSGKTEWICPMHPEIAKDAPGSCPLCGMALEPRMVMMEEENPELIDMKKRFIISAFFSFPVVLIAMQHMIPGISLSELLPLDAQRWAEFLFTTPVVLWCGWSFLVR